MLIHKNLRCILHYPSNINEEEFGYILDPKDTKIESDNTKFVVTENGDYTFKIYQKGENEGSAILNHNFMKKKMNY